MSFFSAFTGPSVTLDVTLTNVAGRARAAEAAPGEGSASAPGGGGGGDGLFIYSNGEAVEGTASIFVPPGKKLEHVGIRAELKGTVGEGVDGRS